jgi:hypothetical protein
VSLPMSTLRPLCGFSDPNATDADSGRRSPRC